MTASPVIIVMKWMIYFFVMAVSAGLLRRDKARWEGYIAWLVMGLCLAFGLLWL